MYPALPVIFRCGGVYITIKLAKGGGVPPPSTDHCVE
jgi:hypothetical protein